MCSAVAGTDKTLTNKTSIVSDFLCKILLQFYCKLKYPGLQDIVNQSCGHAIIYFKLKNLLPK